MLFAKAGAKVVVAGRREMEGRETIDMVPVAGGIGLFVKASKTGEVEEFGKEAVETFGRLDVAFNNAGIEGRIPIAEQSEEDWDRTIDINLMGVWFSLKYEISAKGEQGGGEAIVNTASIAGLMGSAGAATYCASNAESGELTGMVSG